MKKDIYLNVGGIELSNSNCKKLLGVKIDCKLMFDSHIQSLCKKASQKANALSRILTKESSYRMFLSRLSSPTLRLCGWLTVVNKTST